MEYLIPIVLFGAVAGIVACKLIRDITKRMEPYKKEIQRLKCHRKRLDEFPNLPKCNCRDVNQCETWCHAKAMFSKYHG